MRRIRRGTIYKVQQQEREKSMDWREIARVFACFEGEISSELWEICRKWVSEMT